MFTIEEIKEQLQAFSGWLLIPGQSDTPNSIQKEFVFKSYMDGINFTKQIALKAEDANHHPDILVKYAKVVVTISTHDAGGVTNKDFQLAKQIDLLSI